MTTLKKQLDESKESLHRLQLGTPEEVTRLAKLVARKRRISSGEYTPLRPVGEEEDESLIDQDDDIHYKPATWSPMWFSIEQRSTWETTWDFSKYYTM